MIYRETVLKAGLIPVDNFSPTSSRPGRERGPVLEGGGGAASHNPGGGGVGQGGEGLQPPTSQWVGGSGLRAM